MAAPHVASPKKEICEASDFSCLLDGTSTTNSPSPAKSIRPAQTTSPSSPTIPALIRPWWFPVGIKNKNTQFLLDYVTGEDQAAPTRRSAARSLTGQRLPTIGTIG
uniref:Uncharacterized protein n=1 Tax=Odontella aurita TaxID=265563 RepID=A0A7S4N7U8_9STRA|mmetsp:Transcript_51164/g.153715  ORF Transcript_51164/g.153715 Transcript_51164/m.153715 type:complete len:106 (+) Transcript_51164:701-1018(+)